MNTSVLKELITLAVLRLTEVDLLIEVSFGGILGRL